MGALCASTNCAAATLERLPEPIAVNQYPSLVENPVQEEWRPRFNPGQKGDIYLATDDALEIGRQADRCQWPILGKGDQQVKIGGLVLVSSRDRPVENRQADTTLGAKGPTQLGEDLPMAAQVVTLGGVELEPAGAEATAPNRPL
jgi:hypothetical protein